MNGLRGIRFFIVFFIALLSISSNAVGQNISSYDKDSVARYSTLSAFTIKLNLPCLIDPERQSLFFASDIRLSSTLTTDVGLGWFFNDWYVRYNNEKFSGVRARLGFKYFYLENRTKARKRVSPYIGFEAKYNFIREERYNEICRYGCQYEEFYLIQDTRAVMGLAAKYGFHLLLGKQRKWFFDFYGGLGYRQMNLTRKPLPADAEFRDRGGWFLNRPGRHETPDVLLGFYFGYRFS